MRLPRFVLGAVISCVLFVGIMMIVSNLVGAMFSHSSKPKIKLVGPPAPACKVCHCGQTSCHADCGEENMCNLKCEGLCQKK